MFWLLQSVFTGFGSKPNGEAVGSLKEHFSFNHIFVSRIDTHSLKSIVKLQFSTSVGQTEILNDVSAASLAALSDCPNYFY